MKRVDKDIVYELRKEASEYISKVKGKNVSKEDINIAEMLILYGYLKAKLEAKEKKNKPVKKSSGRVSSPAIVF